MVLRCDPGNPLSTATHRWRFIAPIRPSCVALGCNAPSGCWPCWQSPPLCAAWCTSACRPARCLLSSPPLVGSLYCRACTVKYLHYCFVIMDCPTDTTKPAYIEILKKKHAVAVVHTWQARTQHSRTQTDASASVYDPSASDICFHRCAAHVPYSGCDQSAYNPRPLERAGIRVISLPFNDGDGTAAHFSHVIHLSHLLMTLVPIVWPLCSSTSVYAS